MSDGERRLLQTIKRPAAMPDKPAAIASLVANALLRRPTRAGTGYASDESPVIIAGMHRSGTSLVARLLERGGLYVGGSWVERNHESVHFTRANRAMLGEPPLTIHDYGWSAPKSADFIWARKGFAERAAKDLSHFLAEMDGEAGWGWKDPRNSLTLPVWLAVFPNARVLHVVRDGRAVALSLADRDFIDPAMGIALWEHHYRRAEAAMGGLPEERRFTVRYEELLENPDAVLTRLRAFAGVQHDISPEGINTSRVSERLADDRVGAISDNVLLRQLGYV
jgi:hypothetical protein